MSSHELNGVATPDPGVDLDGRNDCDMEDPAADVPVKSLPQSHSGMDVDGATECGQEGHAAELENDEVGVGSGAREVVDGEVEDVAMDGTKTDTAVSSNGSCRSSSPACQDSQSPAEEVSAEKEQEVVEAGPVSCDPAESVSAAASIGSDDDDSGDAVKGSVEVSDMVEDCAGVSEASKDSAEVSESEKESAEVSDVTKDGAEASDETKDTSEVSEETKNAAKVSETAPESAIDAGENTETAKSTVTKDSSGVCGATKEATKASDSSKDTAKACESTDRKVDKQVTSESSNVTSSAGVRTAVAPVVNSTTPSVSIHNNNHNITISTTTSSRTDTYQYQNQYQNQSFRAGGGAMTISGNVLSALAQYGITTGGMTSEQLQQLHEYYRRSQNDTEFILEAPSFIVPYVRESPAQQSAKQLVAALGVAGGESGEGSKEEGDGKKESEQQTGEGTIKTSELKDGGGELDGNDVTDSQKSSGATTATASPTSAADANKENKPASSVSNPTSAKQEQEDFSHLGKWAYYYQGAVGEFVLDQGRNIVEEFIKEDLLKQQRRKAAREKSGGSDATRFAIRSLSANLAASRERNAPFRLSKSQCRFCAFESESTLAMERHLEIPHTVGSIFQCNFCEFESRSHQAILSHMSGEHNVSSRLERAPAVFQCPLCPYEDSGKARMARHINGCQKKFRADRNQSLDDWTPPAKVPRIHRGRPNVLGKQFEPVRGAGGQVPMPIPTPYSGAAGSGPGSVRARGRPVGSYKDASPAALNSSQMMSHGRGGVLGSGQTPGGFLGRGASGTRQLTPGALAAAGMHMTRHSSPSHYQIGNQMYQLVSNQLVPVSGSGGRQNNSGLHITSSALPSGITIQPSSKSGLSPSPSAAATAATLKLSSSPSISITPVPRPSLPANVPSLLRSGGTAGGHVSISRVPSGPAGKQVTTQQHQQLNKGSFVICEICDGYIKDLEQLRNHMQWIHKVKIHPKMIFNRPPLNCQKCQLRFFTDQGLERHLLGSHGLVTSTMQEAANRGQDSGRCPVCGRVFQCKLLQHVARDHRVILKPAHLSYKCTVCTATFGMYKQFENHVYSTHSIVAKKIMESSDRRGKSSPAGPTNSGATSGAANSSGVASG